MLSPDWLLIPQLYSEVRLASFLGESKDIKLTVCTDVMEQKGELESLVSEPLLLTTMLIENLPPVCRQSCEPRARATVQYSGEPIHGQVQT